VDPFVARGRVPVITVVTDATRRAGGRVRFELVEAATTTDPGNQRIDVWRLY
jgi:hypothetical protein